MLWKSFSDWSIVVFFFVSDYLVVFSVALAPVVFEVLGTNGLVAQFSAAFLEDHPFQLMVGCEKDFEEHDCCGVDSDCDQDDTFFSLSGHEEIDVEENESQDCVIEKPVCDERHFFDEITVNSLSFVSFCSPGYVVHIAKSIDQHHMGVSSLINHVTDSVDEQLEHKAGMCGQMNNCYNEITGNVDAGDNENQSTLSVTEDITETIYRIDLQINP